VSFQTDFGFHFCGGAVIREVLFSKYYIFSKNLKELSNFDISLRAWQKGKGLTVHVAFWSKVWLSVCTDDKVLRYWYKGRVSLSVHFPRASLSVQCTDNKVCTDEFGTDSESDKGGLVIRTVPILCLQVLNFPLTFPLTKIIPPYLNLQKKNNNYVFENLICFVRML